ncbi:MAG: DUF11 domain-containing protein [Gemmatimonadota bacterium]|nr:MAG: DUF11 domain-containing protein [Gemmatimonadota bacterium]
MTRVVSTLARKRMLLHILLSRHFREKLRYLIPCLALILNPLTIRGLDAQGKGASSHPDSLSAPQWRLSVSDPYYPIRPGLTIIYIITYENTGGSPAANATLVSILDPLTEYLLSTGAGIYNGNCHCVTWDLGEIEPAGGGRVILRVQTLEGIPHGTEVVNSTTISCAEGIHSDTTLITPITYISILKIYKTTPVISAYPGQEIVYDLQYTNVGDTSAANVLLTDLLPRQTSFVSCTQGCLFDSSEESISWEIGEVRPGSLFAVQLILRIDSTFSGETSIINEAKITCDEESSDSSFCVTTVDTTATTSGFPAFAFFIKSRDHFVSAGNEMLYRIHCENIGRETAHALMITNPIPEHTDYVNSSNGGQYDPSCEKVTWSLEELERHQEKTVTLTVSVTSPLSPRTVIINRATVTCSEGFSASALDTTIVLSSPKWDLRTWTIPQIIIPGQPVIITTRLSNVGNMNATNTVITNPIPPYTFHVNSTNEGVFDAEENAVTWNIGALNVNDASTVSLTLSSDANFPPDEEIINRVYVRSQETADSAAISIPVFIPQGHQLSQNHPNPFNKNTTIDYQLSKDDRVLLKIHNILAQEIAILVDEYKKAGVYSVGWDGRDAQGQNVPSGIYLFTLSVHNGVWSETKKMVLLQ